MLELFSVFCSPHFFSAFLYTFPFLVWGFCVFPFRPISHTSLYFHFARKVTQQFLQSNTPGPTSRVTSGMKSKHRVLLRNHWLERGQQPNGKSREVKFGAKEFAAFSLSFTEGDGKHHFHSSREKTYWPSAVCSSGICCQRFCPGYP